MSKKRATKKVTEGVTEGVNLQLSMNLEPGKEGPDGIILTEGEGKFQPSTELSIAERIARTCHEVNRAFCEGHGDFSQVPWDEAPKWVHDSAMQGVKYFHENPNARPQDMHDSWVAQKCEDGWSYGKEKDPIKKTHPCMVTYRELPFQQKAKDILFITIVKSFVTV